MTRARIRLGQSGEDLACRTLRRRGYEILARRHRTRFGEIDIIARDGPTLVFVEVKTRTGRDYGWGAEAVTVRKQHHIRLVAEEYLLHHHLQDVPCRFDVIAVTYADGGSPRIEIMAGAF